MSMNKNEILDRLRTIYDSCSNEDTKKQILDLIIDIGKDNKSNLNITWDNGPTIKGIPCDYKDNNGPGVGPHTGTVPFNGYNTVSNSKELEKGSGELKLSDIFPNFHAEKGSNSTSIENIKTLSNKSYKSPLIKKGNDSNNASYTFKDDDGTKGLHTQK